MKEVWKPVPGYDNYLVSLNGVKSLNYRNKRKEKVLTPGISQGHAVYTLSKDNVHKTFGLHVLVWLAFVGPIPEGCIVHHVNENPSDNRIENLMLVSKDEHMKTHKAKPVLQCDMQGNVINEWPSLQELNRIFGYSQGLISLCCNNKREKAYGFTWRYKF
jgi:hypothetical protein